MKKKTRHKLTDPSKMGRNIVRLCVERKIGIAENTLTETPTVYAISSQADIPETTLRQIMSGDNYPGMETLHKLGNFFGITVGDLLVELTK